MLGVISFDAARYGPASILTAISTAAQEAGYLVSSIALGTADRATVVEAVKRLSAEGADGVIAIAPQLWVGRALAETTDLGTDLVVLESALDDSTPLVTGDSRTGARKATEHLLALGHTTVWRMAGPAGWTSADHRLTSWRATLRAAGAAVPEPRRGLERRLRLRPGPPAGPATGGDGGVRLQRPDGAGPAARPARVGAVRPR
ncbi:DNA-binding LacI/PurR family transcriptional regulator [Streptomyces sp. AK010]|nr:DNA-binding LacI/PurR family transcriptional regulator [Streptomyces sp. AK010]